MEAPRSYRFAPPTVNPDETTVARWYDDRTRRACVTRGEGSCEGAVDSLGRVAPWEGTKKHSKTTYRGPAELAYLRVTHCAKWSFGFGAGWDRREIFVFLFGSECARPPVCPGWMSRPVRRRRRRQSGDSRVISSFTNTLLPLRVCVGAYVQPPSIFPGGLGSTET